MFIYAITPIHSNPVEDKALPTVFASTWRQVGRIVRAHAEANRGLFDDVTQNLHTDMGLTFEVTKGAETLLTIVTPVVTKERTIQLFTETREPRWCR